VSSPTSRTAARSSAPAVEVTPAQMAPAPVDPGQKMALYALLPLLFFVMSSVHEALRVALHINLYPLYIFGIPALAGLVLSGGIQRAFRERAVLYWTGFCACFVLAVPFSSWRSSSALLVFYYFRTVYVVLLFVAGLTVSWRDCKLVMRTIAVAATAFVGVALVFKQVDNSGRSGLEFGSLQNSNDLAAVLILLLPFLLWFLFSSRWLVLRLAACGMIVMGFYAILHTGSRGSLVALVVASFFYLWRATWRQRLGFLCLAPIAAATLLAVVPKSALNRITQFSQAATIDDTIALAAAESTQSRMRLLRTSIEYTLHFPLFGVGPGQFLNYEGQHDILPGLKRGMWHVTHNAYTQVSSECGIPAFLFYIAAIVASFRLLSRVYRQARARSDGGDIRAMAFCLMLSMTGFCAAIVFLSLAYSVYLPVLSGLAVAVARAAPEEFRARSATAAASPALVGTFAGWPAARRQPPGI
jgi:hypothetical protein